MSKAEELSRQYVLPFLNKLYEVYGEHRQMQLSKFDGYDMMSAYEEGYQQAEKDLELTWKDMEQIYNICCEVFLDYEVTRTNIQKIWKEVLKRFKDLKKCI